MFAFGSWRRKTSARVLVRLAWAVCAPALAFALLACSSESEPTPDASTFNLPAPASTASAFLPLPAAPAVAVFPPPAALATLPSISDLVRRVNPAVASISVESVQRGVFFDFNDEGAGSGVVIREDGYIVTNYHVVQNADEIAVGLPSGDTYTARIVGQDLITDLAVIKVDTDAPLPTAALVSSDGLNVGDWVVAVGNALALKGGPTVTLGIVSAKGRTIDTQHGVLYDMIQTDAAINDGNSGGPVVNMNGEVIGISTAIYRQAQGIGFAVSSSVAAPIIDSLIEHGRVVRPLIGLSGTDVTPTNANRLSLPVEEGIIVTRMSRDGPAARAGIQVGDVVTKMDGIPTPDMAKFLTRLWSYEVDDVVELEYISEGVFGIAEVRLAERPADIP